MDYIPFSYCECCFYYFIILYSWLVYVYTIFPPKLKQVPWDNDYGILDTPFHCTQYQGIQ